jgi:hypothetical protein
MTEWILHENTSRFGYVQTQTHLRTHMYMNMTHPNARTWHVGTRTQHTHEDAEAKKPGPCRWTRAGAAPAQSGQLYISLPSYISSPPLTLILTSGAGAFVGTAHTPAAQVHAGARTSRRGVQPNGCGRHLFLPHLLPMNQAESPSEAEMPACQDSPSAFPHRLAHPKTWSAMSRPRCSLRVRVDSIHRRLLAHPPWATQPYHREPNP